jgi:hypothetical protein
MEHFASFLGFANHGGVASKLIADVQPELLYVDPK